MKTHHGTPIKVHSVRIGGSHLWKSVIEAKRAGDFEAHRKAVAEWTLHADKKIEEANKAAHLAEIRQKQRKDKWTIEDRILAGAIWLMIVRHKLAKHPTWPERGERALAAPLKEATVRSRLNREGIKDQTKAKQIVREGLEIIAANPDGTPIRNTLNDVFSSDVPNNFDQLLARASNILN